MKVYKNQTAFRLILNTKLAESDFSTVASAIIKYIKPDLTTGSFIAVLGDCPFIYYQITSSDDLNIAGEWVFWPYLTFNDTTEAPGESDTLYIYEEG